MNPDFLVAVMLRRVLGGYLVWLVRTLWHRELNWNWVWFLESKPETGLKLDPVLEPELESEFFILFYFFGWGWEFELDTI